MSLFRTLLAGAAAAFALSGAANAALVTVRDNPNNGSSVFATGLGRNVAITHNGANRTVGAGVFSLQYQEGAQWNDFLTFCLQLDEWLTLPKLHSEVASAVYFPDGADRTALGILYGDFMSASLGLKNSTTAAALQTIIWEIVEDGATNFNLSAGSFRVRSSDVLSAANLLWAELLTGNHSAVKFKVFAARDTQDLLVSDVPLPAAGWLFLSAVAGLGFSRRNRKG